MKFFTSFVRAAFEQRRKTLSNSVSSALGFDKSDIIEILKSCGISEAVRAEALSLEDLARISNALYKLKIKE